MFSIITNYPVAAESEDHLHPHGTANDNHGDPVFVQEVEQHFGRKFGLMDLGCAGGQWVIDAVTAGNRAVGVEGSDYNVRNGQFNWPVYYQKNLFTANVGKPFVVLRDGGLTTFDLITAWEVLEHIEHEDLGQLMRNIENHLAPDGLFVGTVNYTDFVSEGHHYHRTVMKEKAWRKLFERRFEVRKYPFRNYMRHDCVDIKDSFLVCLSPKK